ncbi:MAG TPA: hypothetical protein PK299_15280 [Anaerolineales bacterium]|nr:hypothetical protein [Anaerolineales bacterium]
MSNFRASMGKLYSKGGRKLKKLSEPKGLRWLLGIAAQAEHCLYSAWIDLRLFFPSQDDEMSNVGKTTLSVASLPSEIGRTISEREA